MSVTKFLFIILKGIAKFFLDILRYIYNRIVQFFGRIIWSIIVFAVAIGITTSILPENPVKGETFTTERDFRSVAILYNEVLVNDRTVSIL